MKETTNTPMHASSRVTWMHRAGWGLAAIACGLVCMPACGGSDLRCGEGTVKRRTRCLPANAPSGGGSGGEAGGGGMGGGGSGATGGTAESPDAGPPEPIPELIEFTGVRSAAPAGEDSIHLAWRPAAYPVRPLANIEYGIYGATTSGAQNFTEPMAVAPPGSTDFLLDGLTAGEELYVVVRAISPPGIDENSVELSAIAAPDTTPPTFAGATGAEPAGPGQVTVSWDAATDDLTPPEGIIYHVFWSDTAEGAATGELGAVSLPGDTSVVVPGLPVPEATYYFYVKAFDAAGNVAEPDAIATEVSAAAGPDDVPPVFGGCRALSEPKANGVTVLWDTAVDDTTAPEDMVYNIYAFKVPVDEDTTFTEPAETFTGVTEARLKTLDEATTYRIVCRAADAFGNEEDNRLARSFKTLNDGTPPEFAGLESVEIGSTEALLTWTAATDDQSATEDLIYEVHISSTVDGFDFAVPFQETFAGATSTTVFDIPSNSDLYFIVRARDEAGNVDENTASVFATSLVSFVEDVQPIFSANCAKTTCHVPPAPPQGQNLAEGAAYVNIVDVIALQGANIGEPEVKRIDSTSPDPMDSYLWRKITATQPFFGQQMPADPGGFLTPEQIATIEDWIAQGAQNN